MERDSFVFYRSFYEAIRRQPKKVQADIYNTIADYALNGTEPTQASDAVLSIFLLISRRLTQITIGIPQGKRAADQAKPIAIKKRKKRKPLILKKKEKRKPMVLKTGQKRTLLKNLMKM